MFLVATDNVSHISFMQKSLQLLIVATPMIKWDVDQMESKDRWLTFLAIGNQLADLASDFDPRNCGFGKIAAFELEQLKGKPLRIQAKQTM
ncbi:OST-HTH/LOTUS domain-containing protein [Ochrobactrum quorumnocens]|uniref:OST-HTH/LOTUS domain-containing protein n=1 Tax=Ochrobactrum quorumnocens TaxID=271865 RepID=UPI003BA2FF2E